jgi:hypothetical protein
MSYVIHYKNYSATILKRLYIIIMVLLSEMIVQELLKEGNNYPNRYALSIKIAGKNLQSNILTVDEKNEINRILVQKGLPVRLQ